MENKLRLWVEWRRQSTITSLLLRKPDSGTIFLMVTCRGFSYLSCVNKWLGAAGYYLFGGTIKENIAYGKPGATDGKYSGGRKTNAFIASSFPENMIL